MYKRILAEAVIIAVGTTFFIALAASVGIPGRDRDRVNAVGATREHSQAVSREGGEAFPSYPRGPMMEAWER